MEKEILRLRRTVALLEKRVARLEGTNSDAFCPICDEKLKNDSDVGYYWCFNCNEEYDQDSVYSCNVCKESTRSWLSYNCSGKCTDKWCKQYDKPYCAGKCFEKCCNNCVDFWSQCDDCQRRFCDGCLYECPLCAKFSCHSCGFVCDTCHKPVCHQCFFFCYGSYDLSRCKPCGEKYMLTEGKTT